MIPSGLRRDRPIRQLIIGHAGPGAGIRDRKRQYLTGADGRDKPSHDATIL